jgi:predicted O-methyltransferase YrrM
MGVKRARINATIRSTMLEGQTTWSTQVLAAHDTRFEEVWDVASLIPGWFGEVHAAAQFLVLAELRPRMIVEIGSYLGKSTVFFAKSLEVLGIDGSVTSIDPHTGDRQHLENLGVSELPSFDMFRVHLLTTGVSDRVHTIVATSHEAAKDWSDPIDFLFIDGWHSYEAVIDDGQNWLPHLTDRGVVVFDDATTNGDVSRAINDLVASERIHLYGDAFGQAFAGRRPEVPESVQRVLASYLPLTRHLPVRIARPIERYIGVRRHPLITPNLGQPGGAPRSGSNWQNEAKQP